MSIGPLDLGAVTVRDRVTGEVIGHAYSILDGRGQRQRWLLHRHPQNSFTIGAPTPEMARWTLDDWNRAVPDLWSEGAYYIRAQADIYEHGGVYEGVTWDRIPERLPAPTYPPYDDDFQLDHHPSLIDIEIENQVRVGWVYTEDRLQDATNKEYWLLTPRYSSAGARSQTSLRDGPTPAAALSTFVEHANRSWIPGAKLVIVGCKNYHGSRTPRYL